MKIRAQDLGLGGLDSLLSFQAGCGTGRITELPELLGI